MAFLYLSGINSRFLWVKNAQKNHDIKELYRLFTILMFVIETRKLLFADST